MKNPKKPTREQRKAIEAAGLDARDWKIVKTILQDLEIINVNNSEIRRISLNWR